MTLTDLPRELLLDIFPRLNRADTRSLRATCRTFRATLQYWWNVIILIEHWGEPLSDMTSDEQDDSGEDDGAEEHPLTWRESRHWN
jgi:hypothetical protein